MYSNQFAYRSAAAEGATQIGLLTLAYDGLAHDLTKAAEAISSNDIVARCNASNHALLLLGHLDSWIQFLDDSTLAASLAEFYQTLRHEVLRFQQRGTREDFQRLASLVLETRAVWQRKEQMMLDSLSATVAASVDGPATQANRHSGWSA